MRLLLGMLLVMNLVFAMGCNSGVCSDDDCMCTNGDNCDFDCPQGNCSQQCQADSDCAATCAGGDCSQQCAPGATCDFSCEGGNCSQQCAGSDECSLSCSGNGCTTDSALNNLNLGI